MKILKDSAMEDLKQASITNSTSIQLAQVIEAHAFKVDGHRIDASKQIFSRTRTVKTRMHQLFSDLTTLFPDVAVGNTVGLSNKITKTEAMFDSFVIRALPDMKAQVL